MEGTKCYFNFQQINIFIAFAREAIVVKKNAYITGFLNIFPYLYIYLYCVLLHSFYIFN